MFLSNLKIAWRTLARNKTHALISIFGLAVGLAAALLILINIRFELSYDRFLDDADRIYRVAVLHHNRDAVEFDSPQFVAPLGPAMAQALPEIELQTRISVHRTSYFTIGARSLKTSGIIHADSTFFRMFSFRILAGDANRMLAEPFSIVLTEGTARRLFGSGDAMGKTIIIDGGEVFKVSGIVQNPPQNSHIRFTALLSFSTLYHQPGWYMGWNGGNQYMAYVKLRAGARPDDVEQKLPDLLWKNINADLSTIGMRVEAYLQPLKEIHLLHSDSSGPGMLKIMVLSVIALLILLMAAINFINLTTARSMDRAREVGLRKVLGADRGQLIKQFLLESLIISLAAMCIALLIVEMFYPAYLNLVGLQGRQFSYADPLYALSLVVLVLIVGLSAGLYPAMYISSFQPVKSLKGLMFGVKTRTRTRNALVIVQFIISVTLIICTIFINRQLTFVQNKELGFNREQIMVVPLAGKAVQLKSGLLKAEFSNISSVISTSASSEIPVHNFTSNGYFPDGYDSPVMIHVVDVDEDFLSTYGIKLVAGRNFSKERPADSGGYIINQALARDLGWDNPLGKTIERNGRHTVIGLVADFHYASMYHKIEPLIITNRPWNGRFANLSLKVRPDNLQQTIDVLSAVWSRIIPDKPFDYWFLSDRFAQLYNNEQRFQAIFFYFSMLALIIAVMGLFSLASLTTRQRTREIGIRKVLGASGGKVAVRLSLEFLKPVFAANLIAWPLAWLAIQKMLQHFAYKINLSLVVFMIAAGFTLLVALISVGGQALRAARANPADALRYE